MTGEYELIYTEDPRICIDASCDCWIAKTVDGVHYQTVHAARGDRDTLALIKNMTNPRLKISTLYHKLECMFDALDMLDGACDGYLDSAQVKSFEVVVWIRKEPATDDGTVWGYRDMIQDSTSKSDT